MMPSISVNVAPDALHMGLAGDAAVAVPRRFPPRQRIVKGWACHAVPPRRSRTTA
jgi:hypothetical protein